MFPKWAWSGSREQFLHCGLGKFRHSKSAAVTRAGDDEVGLDGGLEATVSTENDSAAGTCVDHVFAVVHEERNPRETESGTHTATQSSQ